jgi:hypothetical protein
MQSVKAYIRSSYGQALMCIACIIGGKPIAVSRVVVVDVATRIDIPRIVGIAAISTTQPNVLLQLTSHVLSY